MKKKKMISSVIILSSVLLLGACGSKDKETSSSSKKESSVAEQVVSFGIPQEVASLDPATATDKVSFGLLNQIYEGFYRMDKDNQPIPAGAKELAEKSDDGLTYTLTLRDDATWSNGDPVIAADYVYAWQRVADPATGSEYAYLLEPVKNAADVIKGDKKANELGIEAVSDTEVKITLEVATPYFESLLAFPTFFPLNQKSVEEFGKEFASSSETSVYNGAFVLSEFDGVGSDLQWSYLKNEDYWDAKNVKISKVNAQVVKEASTALNLFEDGQLDDVIITGELAQQYRADDNYVTESDGRTIYVDVNKESDTQPFDNVNLRKALSYALDGEAIVNNVLGDGSTVSTGIVPRELATNPVTKKDFVEDSGVYKQFDEEKAKDYFEKAKKELNVETVTFDIMTDDNDSTKKIAEYMQGAYKDVLGIKTTVTPVTKPIRLDRTSAGDYDMVLTGWGADYNDPGSFLDLFVTGNPYNRGRYANPAYDELIKEASIKNGNDLEARWQNYLDAEKLLLETDAGIIPVYQVVEGHLRNPKMKGYVSHTAGASYDYKDMYLED
ncbi:peptide ABC transporter substrate-binding protein [Vagococcus sp. BWB3-3]|uniref:Peptide ABC transporter substrate-binding protein n=1 Tax=Vagococcus allomyrinae TaxID=2794353 RepID=A0A940P8C5_9ENTE|nr:peptide ABC transporter substrate-binding protein [Vagococcus allomyrinae]MBP1041551.1 peptide ABC transporter substrate-binding protein [Vagococcus allomyrinae]